LGAILKVKTGALKKTQYEIQNLTFFCKKIGAVKNHLPYFPNLFSAAKLRERRDAFLLHLEL
jgi:hypothetical protein